MSWKLMGAVLIVVGCGGFGVMMAMSYKREIRELICLEETVLWMICELEFRQTALPALIRSASARSTGRVAAFFEDLAAELDSQIAPDAASCVEAVLAKRQIPEGIVANQLCKLGKTLGAFELEGQLNNLRMVLADCQRELQKLETDRPQRVRSYQTLGLCAGAALAILFV